MKFNQFDEETKKMGFNQTKSDWFKLEEGDNKIRILTESEPLTKHFDPLTRKSSICIGKKRLCPGCMIDDGNRPSTKFLMWVIDRRTNEIKIAELGYSITKAIADYSKSEDYAFDETPIPYDITIKKTKTGKNAKDVEYSVIPARSNTSITKEEQEKINKLKSISEIILKMKEKAAESYGLSYEAEYEDEIQDKDRFEDAFGRIEDEDKHLMSEVFGDNA